ncbi:disease resistance protein RGA5-like [Miscanthus floridulus]|uniref:disease resistance protein RGA5-like n=1 Tax=Miscanthus floridulus TaxID=154761 RepID=UPI003459AAA5
MSVVTGALGSLAPKLLQLLHDEYKLQKGVRKQVQWLHSELESIYAFLGEVAEVPWDRLNGQVKVWAREVREASYDMEDVLDTFLVRVEGGEPTDPSRLKRAMKKMGKVFSKAKARRGIAGAIEDIKKNLEELAKRRLKYKLDDNVCNPLATSSTLDPCMKAMCKEVTRLIGVDKSRDELISMLNNPSQPDDVAPDKKITKKVSIVGVGGLGKTTLAKAAYDNLKSHYDCAAFVSVGRDHDLVKVFKDILFELDKIKYDNIHNTRRGVALLIREVQEFLENKRYFIVIDDVWDVPTWEAIKLSLVENNCVSKVITTTRKFDVANEAGDVYKLKPLSDDDSMKLLYTRIFGAEGKYHDKEPEDVINKIVKKCGGIPLAIVTTASLLAGKQKYEWSEVLNSIGFGSKGNMEAEETMTILSFSYYDLPPHLRTCLLYLSTYPEDYVIRKDSLIWKWVAKGFIDGKQGTRLFELGERYFNDLINRSLIQVVENDLDGTVSGCRVHDMVLDLMRKLSSEENFIAILGGNVEGTPAPSNVRRLTHQNRIAEHNNSEAVVIGMPKVRSYTAFMCCIDSRGQFLRFKLLRVLDIVGCNFKEGCHLEHLGDLLHLRYLRIKFYGRFLELPIQLGNLKLLQTLDVGGTLPASIVQLKDLVRLCAQYGVPDGIRKLVSLEELRIVIGCSDKPKRFFKELASLRELRVLVFGTQGTDESMQRDFVESLSNMQKLQYIHVHSSPWLADTAMWEAVGLVLPRPLHYLGWHEIRLSKLPSCINPSALPILAHLELFVITMDEQDLKLLARLPVLCYLNLTTWSTVTASNINSSDRSFFQKLRYFEFNQMVQFEQPDEEDASVSLHIWNGEDATAIASRNSSDSRKVVPSGVMPNLEVLCFNVNLRALKDNYRDYCGNIGLEYLPSLRELRGWIIRGDMPVAESDAALAPLRDACNVHPNHPTFRMLRSY